jgi:hypothetical protein
MSVLEVESVLELCYKHVGIFGKTFLPEAFSTPFVSLHNEIIEALDSPAQKVAIAAPRGLGKTTLARALVINSILFREYEFILYVSQSESLAMMQTENIKREILSNREIKRVFGSIKIAYDDSEMDESFSKHTWTAFGSTLVMPRGSGQQVRGLIFKNFRPQLIIVDDFEDRKELENPENRRKNKEWFHSDLLRCVDRYSDKWKIVYIDTLKHSESLLQELLEDNDWKGLRLDLCDDNYNSNVPELISTEQLLKEAASARKNGTLDIFYMEYRNIPISKENQSFRLEYFQNNHYSATDINIKEMETIVIVDPAKTIQIQNADSAIVGVGINYATGGIYFHDCVSGKMYPDQIYNEMFEMALRLGSHVIGVEVTGLEEFIKQPILNEMAKRGPRYSFEIIWLKARGGDPGGDKGKLKRIGSLVPYYRQGYIHHNLAVCGKLESQLLNFPRSGLVDVADAFAYTIEMLELGNRYFISPPEEKSSSGEDYDEYSELENEDALPYFYGGVI